MITACVPSVSRRLFGAATAALGGAVLLLAVALPALAASADWSAFVAGFVDGYFKLNPTLAVSAGRHEFDGQLPDWSSAGLQVAVDWLHQQQQRAQQFDAAALDEAQRFERDYLLAVVDRELFWLESADWPRRSPTFYSGLLDPDVYVVRQYAPLPARLRAYTRYARSDSTTAPSRNYPCSGSRTLC